MRLPNKVTPYSKSIFAIFPEILKALSEQERNPKDLLDVAMPQNRNLNDFLSALACLFALGEIELDAERRLLRYVEKHSL